MRAQQRRPSGRAATSAAVGALMFALLAAAPAAADERHRVEPGDTVWSLAQRYGSSVSAIVRANGLDGRATIVIGRSLTIPTGTGAASTQAQPSATRVATHVVVAGDTVWSLAHRHGIGVDAIIAANDLGSRALIRVGQTLVLPGVEASSATPAATASTGSSPASSTARTVTVAPGDTLSAIAARNSTTVAALARVNGLTNVNLIRIGQRLTLPGGTGTPTGLVGDTFLGRTYPTDVVASANRHKAALLAREVPSRAAMQRLVVATANAYGVDPALAQAVAYQESGFNMRAVSPADAVGVMQVIPASGEWASTMAGRRLDLLDPEDNVLAGVLILRSHTRSFADRAKVIGAYYQGAAAVRKHGLYPGTVDYVRSVTALMTRFG
ncbi:LysM peptidoglycan-binding domain-containing protein [Demequina lignilytica]|uniref:LysM peptidoglycan-binding domain-containing protein n=1 Tax=Demequina lignilytica TaxID=3051663 RepID=A0AB35MEI3_9MICO|nr:LysM peptidoglycan-binding domain-containing protein [Demequina sp. SYSU T0a273]MDN4482148.1 LysM peptidoglycan-binding domain-containing protein [Demequina sp. SYSU T0a273]